MKVWRNGCWQAPQLFGTLAFQYGFGLFETLLVRGGIPADLDDHIRRLLQSIKHLDAEGRCSFDAGQLKGTVLLSLDKRQEKNEVLKVVAYCEEDQWNFLLLLRPYTYTKKHYEQGFALHQAVSRRNPKSMLVYHKTLNYFENYLERRQALREGYDDAYFLNGEGSVTECTAANLFIVRKGELLTSPVQEGLLPGIMRGKLLGGAKKLGISAREIPLQKDMLPEAEAVLLTNALYGAMPVSRIDNRCYSVDQSFVRRVNTILDRESL
ncbi:hypothetical protein P22_3633 [Propionispora sp. 2/2-37]|uniref:aminotransferase class IV n=1 Tax=Propionispora sp. 2/2-37 TaxID=1677858 RepID=UPI0006BB83B6|nr:aminotransferase class IV [Propionispora sp. 2/2-37]CUH97502.1 hypothetical protein P22_3633 [Propionispora sp. 2/2-37]